MARIDNAEHRAVYHLVSVGGMGAHVAPLYRRQLSALAQAGAIRRREDGAYEAIGGDALKSQPPPASVPTVAPMGTLVCRVPQELLDVLDGMGAETRSEAARMVLTKALASQSGQRKRAG